MKLKLWIIWQVIIGEIVGMSNAPGKPLELQIETPYITPEEDDLYQAMNDLRPD